MDGLRFHHVGVATKDIDTTLTFYRDVLGLEMDGAVVDDEGLDIRACLLHLPGIAGGYIELVAPLRDGSAIRSVLKRGMTYYHACYEVDDLELSAGHLAASGGFQVVPPTPARLFAGRRVTFFMTAATGLIELLEASARR